MARESIEQALPDSNHLLRRRAVLSAFLLRDIHLPSRAVCGWQILDVGLVSYKNS
jgi:hypothetical protein